MLRSLTLTNFQCHREASLEFSPGVNVIAGTSDSGKSAILKGLLWLITNRPQGLDFRSWGCEKGEAVEASISIDDATISRRRSEKVNEYLLNGQRFVAMKAEVPTNIADVLCMGPINIQTQFQPHFLLSSSSAEVARVLNDACDLSIIDRVTKSINEISRQSKADGLALDRQLADLTERLEGLAWVEDAVDLLASVEAEDGRLSAKQRAAEDLNKLLIPLQDAIARLDKATERATILRSVNDMDGLLADLSRVEASAEELEGLLRQVATTDRRLSAILIIPADDISTVSEAARYLARLESDAGDLRNLLQLLAEVGEALNRATANWSAAKKAQSALWQTIETCPLCGQVMHEASHER